MKKTVLALCGAALAGCGHNDAMDGRVIQLPGGGALAETINGTPVPQSLLEAVARQHNWHLDQPSQRSQAQRVLTDLILINQEAQRQNYFAEPQFQADVEAARLKSVADAAIVEFEKRTAIGDDVLKAEYDAQTAHTGKVAYDFTQMLFGTEDEALKVEAEIVAGKPFQQVYDAWHGKAKQARAFTRVRLDQVPDDLAKVLSSMKDGETSKVPVKTQFGWHVVHLDIANPYAPPEFEQVKDGIRRNMQMKINRDRLDKLRETAKVEYPAGVAPPVPGAAPPGITPPPATARGLPPSALPGGPPAPNATRPAAGAPAPIVPPAAPPAADGKKP
jgi:peptidyl-prolyl cis-trans isomerase C